ncbi:MAG: hypothetical protein EOO51_15120, partial [Flavobacterium sp.]
MKQFIIVALLFVAFSARAQTFQKDWNKVIRYENEGRIKSANSETEKILKKATAHNNHVQIVKCFFYKSKFMHVLEENAQVKILSNLNRIKEKSSIPVQAILNTVYAKCLTSYVAQNSYKLYTRKDSRDSTSNFLLWSVKDFQKEIAQAYSKSLEHDEVLKKTSLEKFEQIFDFINADEFKHETVYEYLLRENIEYHGRQANNNGTSIDNKILFATTDAFIPIDFSFIDNEEFRQTLELYQKLEAVNPSLRNRLDRIIFCYSRAQGKDIEY